jgi:hypothetical protein
LIIFKALYQVLAGLKSQYEQLKATKTTNGPLASQAEAHYRNRNYLDAVRLRIAA